ncbi:unnamed protein product [Ectocarpus fasciculatus]
MDAGGSSAGALTPSKGKGRAMHGQRMVEWLETLISKRADLYRSKNELRAAYSRQVKGLQVMEKRLNPRNTKVFLECSMSTWRLGERENCVSVLKSYFQILRMQSRNNARKAAQGGGGTTPLGSDTTEDTYTMFQHTLKMLEIASLFLRPNSSLWLLRMQINSQHQFTAGGVERSARGVFGDMLRIACSAFPSYR